MVQLLQISEPKKNSVVSEKIFAGIDFGTTNSLIALIRSGALELFADSSGRFLLPSVVHYSGKGEILVGYDAKLYKDSDPLNTFFSIKRFLARSSEDINKSLSPYEFSNNSSGLVQLHTTHHEVLSPIEISSKIFLELKKRARAALCRELDGAVVTVPAYFDHNQRQAIHDAASLAGLNVVRLLNEPTAAAIAYGLNKDEIEGIYAVYDLGGGTFDISILSIKNGVFEVLATGGDAELGGDDFDCAIADFFSQFYSNTTFSLSDRRVLLLKAKELREILSCSDHANVKMKTDENKILDLALTSDDLENIIFPLIKRTINCVKCVMLDAGLHFKDIRNVIMVGGTTRMPLIQKFVGTVFDTVPLTDINPEQVVAIGAALQANLLVSENSERNSRKNWTLLDVSPLSLGIETMGGLVEHIISRNTTIPTVQSKEFTTFKDGQTAIHIHVLQGEREFVKDCRSLAKFDLKNIPPMPAGAIRVCVVFKIDANGILRISAQETITGEKSSISINPYHGLSVSKIKKALIDKKKNHDLDSKMKDLIELQIELKKLIGSVENSLKFDLDLLNHREYEHVKSSLKKAENIKNGEDIHALRKSIDSLAQAMEIFSFNRINRSIYTSISES